MIVKKHRRGKRQRDRFSLTNNMEKESHNNSNDDDTITTTTSIGTFDHSVNMEPSTPSNNYYNNNGIGGGKLIEIINETEEFQFSTTTSLRAIVTNGNKNVTHNNNINEEEETNNLNVDTINKNNDKDKENDRDKNSSMEKNNKNNDIIMDGDNDKIKKEDVNDNVRNEKGTTYNHSNVTSASNTVSTSFDEDEDDDDDDEDDNLVTVCLDDEVEDDLFSECTILRPPPPPPPQQQQEQQQQNNDDNVVVTVTSRGIDFGDTAANVDDVVPTNQTAKDTPSSTTGNNNKSSTNNNKSNTSSSSNSDSTSNNKPGPQGNNNNNNNNLVDTNKKITAASDLRDVNRNICIVTTAALPWRTGTAVNPMLRALYLTQNRPKHAITLVIPWLPSKSQQEKLFGKSCIFETQKDQETWIRNYCKDTLKCNDETDNLKILFYSSTYHEPFGSIFATQDICQLIPKETADIAILEEPEHLNWFRVPPKFDDKNVITDEEKRNAELGWTKKFNHVVGILHTNYSAYMKQYGMGTHIIGASALKTLSTIVVRAYCHRIIRLSDTLPPLQGNMEITCNVHGVQSRFLERIEQQTETKEGEEEQNYYYAPIYFIGKLIWAKGFDKLLEIQESYKETHGKYFPIDVYGSGNDSKVIQRAFLGRRTTSLSKSPTRRRNNEKSLSPTRKRKDQQAQLIFEQTGSLRGQVDDYLAVKSAFDQNNNNNDDDDDDGDDGNEQDYYNDNDNNDKQQEEKVLSQQQKKQETSKQVTKHTIASSNNTTSLPSKSPIRKKHILNPLTFFGEVTGKTLDTGIATTQAVGRLTEKLVDAGLHIAFTENNDEEEEEKDGGGNNNKKKKTKDTNRSRADSNDSDDDDDDDDDTSNNKKPKYKFDPPKSRFELRRNPLPARFMGTKDHGELRFLPNEHKIFLNMSTTEVLCTTTAEALAMGKFAIIPNHPSNTFFLQFPNCLAYNNRNECVANIKYALDNKPKELTEQERYAFSWDGANERLYESSGIIMSSSSSSESTDKNNKGDLDIAKFHIESIKKGQLVHKFFHTHLPIVPLKPNLDKDEEQDEDEEAAMTKSQEKKKKDEKESK